MQIRRIVPALAAAALALLWTLPGAAAEGPTLTPSEERGRQLYLTGSSPSDQPVTAFLGQGENRLELPGEAATCGSCHGHDGTGRPESGVLPSNITWSHLTRTYGHVHSGGLEHPPFDDESLGRYLRTGLYPGGRQGDPSMPVYEIADRDLSDLIAYLKRVGKVSDPGIGDSVIRLGTVVPSQGPLAEVGAVIREVLETSFRDVNRIGGIYGRRLELVVHEASADPGSASEQVSAWLEEQRPFALVSPFTPRGDLEVQAAVSGQGIPLVGPFTLYSVRSFALNRNVFYLYPGLTEQVRALIQEAGERLGPARPQVAVLFPQEASLADLVAELAKGLSRQGWPPLHEVAFPTGAFDAETSLEALRATGAEMVISLAIEPELRALLERAAEAGWTPHVLAPGALSGNLLFAPPRGFEQRLRVAYPTLPQDRKPWAMRDLSHLLANPEAARSHLQAAISAYASARVLVEALRRAGRNLGRRELIAELEGLYQFDTGVTPTLSFSANRRIGASGAYVLEPGSLIEGRLPDSVEWIEVP